MSTGTELEALAAICAAVDDAIAGDPAVRERVSKIPGLTDVAGASFAAVVLPRSGGSTGSGGGDAPSADEALVRLAGIAARGDAAATRTLAIAGLVNADPAYGSGGAKRDLVQPALTGGDVNLAKLAPELLAQMERELTSDEVGPAIVEASIVRVILPSGEVDPASRFQTEFIRRGRTLEDMKRVLNPENWPRCCRWWSEMVLEDPGDGRPHYRETVAGSVGFLKVEVCLRFVQAEGPDEIVLDYRMCDVAEHQPENPRVVVDEGSIVAQAHDDGVRVLTNKRVRFADTIGGRSLVPTAGGLGYGMLAEELVDSCLDCRNAEVKWAPVEATNDG